MVTKGLGRGVEHRCRHAGGAGALGAERWAGRRRALGWAQAGAGRWAEHRRVRGRTRGPRQAGAVGGAGSAARALCARPGSAAGPTGCALGALSLF